MRKRSKARYVLIILVLSSLTLVNCRQDNSNSGKSIDSSAISTVLSKKPIILKAYFETGFSVPFKLAQEFSKEYPNVKWDIRSDQYNNLINETPRLLSGPNPPDLIRLPTMVSFAKEGLLKNLDGYAKAYGWDKWPQPQINQNRIAADGSRGSGKLFVMGLNYSLTGVFYNKNEAKKIGMTRPPRTLAELDEFMAKAKAAGLQPIMQWGSAKSGMGLIFPLQALMGSYGPIEPINNWIFQKPEATINTADNVKAVEHLKKWIQAGYFPQDINALEYTDSNARFVHGEGVFTFNGDWENATYDQYMKGNVGFFLMPPASSGGNFYAMSSPLTFGIAAHAKNANAAAFFLNWVATNPKARQIDVEYGGSSPGGPDGLALPKVAVGSITNQTLQKGLELFKKGQVMGFLANATSSIFAQGWTPELQKLAGGRETAGNLLKSVQTEYERELGR